MTAQFTFDAYRRLLECIAGSGYAVMTVREYLETDDHPDRFVVLRHDVDRKPENATKMADLEASLGMAGTYYFRTSTFDPATFTGIAGLGHEVGYHYEDYVMADGDREEAHDRFARNLETFRSVATIDTVCMHGNPLSPHDNRELWLGSDGPALEDYDLLGEAYLSMDFERVTYFSDTGRTWRDGPLKIKDHTMGEGEKTVDVGTTDELADLFNRGIVDRACVLAHPNRWADSTTELAAERTKDGAINLVKRGLHLLPRQ